MGRKRNIDWGSVDWGKQDVEIAALMGVSRQRVGQVRPAGTSAKEYRQRRGVTAEQRIAKMLTEGKTLGEIAKAAGCGEAHARVALNEAGKEYRRLQKGRPKYDWSRFPMEGWRWTEMTDKAIAALVGASSPAVVTQWRIRHGMRKTGRHFGRDGV